MLFADGAVFLIFFAVWLFCLIDVITTPEGACRNLPKLVWLFLVILLFDIGCIAWLVAGRPWNSTAPNLPYKGNRGVPQTPPAPSGPSRASNPDDDEEFLAGLRARAEEQRRRARESQPEQSDGPETPPSSA